MRIKELAALTGSTVRTVRYYHQIGLLPVPERRDGARAYDMTHVARLARVRWLKQAGIPLAAIAAMVGAHGGLGTGTGDTRREVVLSDLRASVKSLDDQLAELGAQRERMASLIAAVDSGGGLSPMPTAVAGFYERMEALAEDDRTRQLIRRERDFLELAFYRGDMPVESALLYQGLTEAAMASSLGSFQTIAERSHPLDDRDIEQIAAGVIERITRHLGPDLPRMLRSMDPDAARRAADLYLRLADPRQLRLDRAIADALLSLIEKGRGQ
jgi:DNA-binding transcriptional MerR regulator